MIPLNKHRFSLEASHSKIKRPAFILKKLIGRSGLISVFQDLFNHYLKKNPGFGRIDRRLSSLEKEVAELRRTPLPNAAKKDPSPSRAAEPPNHLIFPPTITINVNKNEKSEPLKGYTKKITKRSVNPRPKTSPPTNDSTALADVLEKWMVQQTTPPPPAPSETGPTHPTYIEFLNVETIIIDRYEQSNNFGALGIKSLEGKLNIGANYGDKSELPDEAKEKLEKKLKMAKELKTYTESQELTSSKPASSSLKPKPMWDEWEAFLDWDDFFSKQPCDAENNKENKDS